MPSLPFMSMEPYIKKGGSLTWEEKVLNMDEKFWNYEKLYGQATTHYVSSGQVLLRAADGGDDSCSRKLKG
jgi:hypothetical protein